MNPSQRPEAIRAWLRTRPSLAALQAAYPDEWKAVERDISQLTRNGDLEELKAYILADQTPGHGRPSGPPVRASDEERLRFEIQGQLRTAALKQILVSTATGVSEGRLRFNLLNGCVAQKLLFETGLRRKAVSMRWFRILWPVLWQRRFLMPLVEPKGIYCFYSRELIAALAGLIGSRRTLEIAAGDGTLSRLLADQGVDIVATDDHSWRHSIEFPEEVLRQDARQALQRRKPEVVLCSWPPAGNPFERAVFTTPSVELYIVIGSRHRFASGDWTAYGQQTSFEFAEDPKLSRLVLPPEIDPAVHVFVRTPPP